MNGQFSEIERLFRKLEDTGRRDTEVADLMRSIHQAQIDLLAELESRAKRTFEIDLKRDGRGQLVGMTVRPVTPPRPALAAPAPQPFRAITQ